MGNVDLRRSGARRGRNVQRSSHALRELVTELVRRRHAAGLSQTELANRIGTSQRTLSQLENLAHEPKVTTMITWASAVGLRLFWDEG